MRLPNEVLDYICAVLSDTRCMYTLKCLAETCRTLYHVAIRRLYRHLIIKPNYSQGLFYTIRNLQPLLSMGQRQRLGKRIRDGAQWIDERPPVIQRLPQNLSSMVRTLRIGAVSCEPEAQHGIERYLGEAILAMDAIQSVVAYFITKYVPSLFLI